MIRISTLTFICIVAFQLNAQVLGTIKDPDGYTNVRTEPTIKSEIKGQFYSDEIFLIADFDYDTIPDWRFVGSGYTSEHQLRGWMHASRVQDLDLMPEPVRPEISEDQKTITFKNDTILFKVTFQEFDSTNHKIIYDERGYITSIDGKYPQGTDGNLPIENIKNIIFNINGKQVDFPKDAYSDLYNFRKNTWRFYRNRQTGTLMIRSDNSDGGAFYMVVWKFNNYQYKGRFLSSI